MDPLEPVRFVKHGCVCFESDDAVVYVDPYKVPDDAHDADLIVITHSHGDHYSPEDIERVRKPAVPPRRRWRACWSVISASTTIISAN